MSKMRIFNQASTARESEMAAEGKMDPMAVERPA